MSLALRGFLVTLPKRPAGPAAKRLLSRIQIAVVGAQNALSVSKFIKWYHAGATCNCGSVWDMTTFTCISLDTCSCDVLQTRKVNPGSPQDPSYARPVCPSLSAFNFRRPWRNWNWENHALRGHSWLTESLWPPIISIIGMQQAILCILRLLLNQPMLPKFEWRLNLSNSSSKTTVATPWMRFPSSTAFACFLSPQAIVVGEDFSAPGTRAPSFEFPSRYVYELYNIINIYKMIAYHIHTLHMCIFM